MRQLGGLLLRAEHLPFLRLRVLLGSWLLSAEYLLVLRWCDRSWLRAHALPALELRVLLRCCLLRAEYPLAFGLRARCPHHRLRLLRAERLVLTWLRLLRAERLVLTWLRLLRAKNPLRWLRLLRAE